MEPCQNLPILHSPTGSEALHTLGTVEGRPLACSAAKTLETWKRCAVTTRQSSKPRTITILGTYCPTDGKYRVALHNHAQHVVTACPHVACSGPSHHAHTWLKLTVYLSDSARTCHRVSRNPMLQHASTSLHGRGVSFRGRSGSPSLSSASAQSPSR